MKKKNKNRLPEVFIPFVQEVGIVVPPGIITSTTVQIYMDKKGRMRDHNGKKIAISYGI